MTTPRTLQIVDPPDAQRTVEVQGAPWLIGRQQGCQLVLQHSSVSRQHAKLIQDPNGDTLITDLESSNGTKLNGEDLTPHAPYRLRPGDVLTLGIFRLNWSGPEVEPTIDPDAGLPSAAPVAVSLPPEPAAPPTPAAAPPEPSLPEAVPVDPSLPEAVPVSQPAPEAPAAMDPPPVSSPPLVPAEPSQAPPEAAAPPAAKPSTKKKPKPAAKAKPQPAAEKPAPKKPAKKPAKAEPSPKTAPRPPLAPAMPPESDASDGVRESFIPDDLPAVKSVEDPGAELSPLDAAAASAVSLTTDQIRKAMSLAEGLADLDQRSQRLALLCRQLAGPVVPALSAAVLRLDAPHWETKPRLLSQAIAPAADPNVAEYVSRTLLKCVHERKLPVLASNRDSSADDDAQLSMSPDEGSVVAMAGPLRVDDESMDVLYLLMPAGYGTAQWLALISIATQQFEAADRAAEARVRAEREAAVQRDLLRAREIQHALVPASQTRAGLEIAVGFEPCHEVGGDYVDVVPMPDGRTLLALADVCGKGIQASLVCASLHGMLRACINAGLDLGAVGQTLNAYLVEHLPEGGFATLVAAAVDPGSGQVEVFNAGHPPPLVVKPDGSAAPIDSGIHTPLGVEPIDEPETQTLALGPGAGLLLYSDGITEGRDTEGQMLGIDNLAGSSNDWMTHATPGQAGVDAALAALMQSAHDRREGAPPDDDCTCLLARRAAE
ncbi:MAG: SpoIIE family protein phosphatase [Planctomycetota bacterium]